MKKKAFTLAEVLITLGIIGVVAAITIPSLLTRINEIKLQAQFKEGYSVLAQMVKMYNGDDERTSSNSYSMFYKDFIKYFTGVTDCGTAATVSADTK
ncbi:MAG: type II secretion system GspH family protein, partial [Candidatus Gastranaerophilales bacterium]|nr:type II secretion system GspH family protein [Candidatus Gastranaerophilales bacterium]